MLSTVGQSGTVSIVFPRLILVFNNKFQKSLYIVQTSYIWTKFMFFISWVYIFLTLFEPVHYRDVSMERWDDRFTSLFIAESCILFLFWADIIVAIFHNFYEQRFKEMPNLNKKHNSPDKPQQNSPEVKEGDHNKRNTVTSSNLANKIKSRHNNHLNTFNKSQKSINLDNTNNYNNKNSTQHRKLSVIEKLKILLMTILTEGNLIYKLVLFIIFLSDYLQYNIRYPNHIVRYSRFIRTLTFPLFSKSTLRTLQAVYFSLKRIFDFFIFFSVIIFVYAGLGYKVFEGIEDPYYMSVDYDPYVNNYDSYSVIANSLIVLVTFDNYPLVMRPFISNSE